MTVWVVTDGEYSEHHIEGIFSTEEKAREYIKAHRIEFAPEAWEMDEPDAEVLYCLCRWKIAGKFVGIMYKDRSTYPDSTCGGGRWFDFYVSTKHQMFAMPPEERNRLLLKIAQDRYAEYRAREEGIT